MEYIMKLRIVLCILVKLFMCGLLFAGSWNGSVVGNIINYNKESWKEKNATRSIISSPVITQEGRLIRIYSHTDLQNVQVIVTDDLENIIYSDVVCVIVNQPYLLMLPDELELNHYYKIELIHGQQYLYGYFMLK